jgi:hypothetical protein
LDIFKYFAYLGNLWKLLETKNQPSNILAIFVTIIRARSQIIVSMFCLQNTKRLNWKLVAAKISRYHLCCQKSIYVVFAIIITLAKAVYGNIQLNAKI